MNAARFGERELDRALAHWVARRSGSLLLARAAFAASRGEGQGHACAALGEDPTFDAADLAALRAHPWVGEGAHFTPFVLDEWRNFYTWRNFRHETRLAELLRERALARTLPLAAATLAADVGELFAGSEATATAWQRAAVAAVPGARLFVLTGGPGTGKTTTVLRMLLMLLRHAAACGLPAQPQVALAAPTGKAAQRLARSLALGTAALRASLPPGAAWCELLGHIPTQAQTLHRLLGFDPREHRHTFGAAAPLPADVVVVDEASMVDLALMRQMVESLRPQAVLLLVGDPGQLYSVEAGSVLGDIVAACGENALPAELARRLRAVTDAVVDAPSDAAPLAGQVLTLRHVWRAGGGLRDALDALRRGETAGFEALLDGADAALRWRDCGDAAAVRAHAQAWVTAEHELFDALLDRRADPRATLARLHAAQVLCALRDGPFGAAGINRAVTEALARRGGFDPRDEWHHGRPVIVTRNDYARGLYNGDLGVALDGPQGLRVWFEDGGANLRSFSPRALPAHETAFAITIHRSQGSEYDRVAVVLPPAVDHPLLSRELLYTAVSRARHGAELWGTRAALRAATAHRVRRHGGLRERLR
jgi:exodeoxyribonuclease V alpha subunit